MGFIFKPWKNLSLFKRIMVGFVLGIIAGFIFGEKASMFNFLGTILTNLLMMVVAPLVLCLLVCAAGDMGDAKRLGRIGIKSVAIFLSSTALAIVLGLVISNLINIGSGISINVDIAKVEQKETVSMLDTLINIIPKNIFKSLAEGDLLQIIFFALIFGFSLSRLGDTGKKLLEIFEAGQKSMEKLTDIVLQFTPYGVFGLMANVIGTNGADILIPYLKSIAALYLSSLIYLIFVQGILMVGIIGKVNPIKFFKTMKEPMAFVFATCSSVATIPLNLESVKKLGVDDETANFVIPFGAVVNMNGTAIYQAVAVVFTAQVFGIDLSFTEQAMVMLTATLASIGTAGIPGSGLVMLTIVLSSVNLPMEAIGLLAGIDRILNMGRVVPNIVGDAATSIIVARTEKTLNN
ncbi:dicarboxylate/amino acid:cation symporter [Peptoniphilus porci]|uniref:Sodium:dicarboxylate symporter n=1 Tax=Peptoniphilus porci TaxID=2652280 RepID=A0A1U7M0S9_9FIRM|nr:dicarboxylate/amino acid:cation symporter [Peptoniphilus porci]OLR65280.1 sodium:dicarboxylate symporter [Peptoniphilus porci]